MPTSTKIQRSYLTELVLANHKVNKIEKANENYFDQTVPVEI